MTSTDATPGRADAHVPLTAALAALLALSLFMAVASLAGTVPSPPHDKLPFVAEDFLMSFSIPNMHFHATTAYGMLRAKGVPLGKRDYLGRMRMKK